jgi:hypothetical protein
MNDQHELARPVSPPRTKSEIMPIRRWYLPLLGLLVLAAYVSPWVIRGENSYAWIHDGLEQLPSFYKAMRAGGFWFASNTDFVGPIFDTGMARVSYPAELKLNALLFAILPPYWAYVALEFAVRVIGFLGAVAFLHEVAPNGQPARRTIIYGAALTFAVLPFWVWTGGIAALPWMAFVAARVWRGRTAWFDYALLLAYPFISDTTMTGYLVVGLFWLLALVTLVFRRFRVGVILAVATTTLAHVVADYRLFTFALLGGPEMHRDEFDPEIQSLAQGWRSTTALLTRGDFYAPSFQQPVVVLVVVAAALLAITGWLISRSSKQFVPFASAPSARALFLWLIGILATWFVAALFAGFWRTSALQFIGEAVPIFRAFNLARITSFNSFVWMLILALACMLIGQMFRRWAAPLLAIVFAVQCGVVLNAHEFLAEQRRSDITYSAFFSERLFDEIARVLPPDRSSYLVGSIGLQPAIATYNGFRTVDAYAYLYPLEYKHRFRAAIEPELNKAPELKSYFDGWGSRVYLFAAEAACMRTLRACSKDHPAHITGLDFDMAALRALGARYLFSMPIIDNAAKLGLVSLGTFEGMGSAWRITVYELK